MKRQIPEGHDGKGLPPDGWCHNPKGMPKPLNCSWCDEELIDCENGLILCPACDLLDRRECA